MRTITLFNGLIVAALVLSACAAPTTAPVATATAAPSATALQPTPTRAPATATLPASPATATAMMATPKPPSPTATNASTPITACPGALPIAHQVGKTVMVSTATTVPNRVRAKPSRQADLLGQLNPGEQAKITGGPVCADGYTWWQVQAASGLTGWTVEGDEASYWLVDAASAASNVSFAAYKLPAVQVSPAVKADPIDPGMGNVLVPLVLSPEQLARLGQSGVVASPRTYSEFSDLYAETVQANLPLFVTSDSLLHTYHLLFDKSLRDLEAEVFLPKLRLFNKGLLDQAQAQYRQLKGTAWEDAALRVVAYVAVGSKLSGEPVMLPQEAANLVTAELALINAAAGPAPSPIFTHLRNGEDYSQYMPRSHYTRSEELKAYFKAMMWYGRMTFRLNDATQPEAGPAETRMALLLTHAVYANSDLPSLWSDLYDPTAFLVGRSDDLTIGNYRTVMDTVYGPKADLKTIADDGKLTAFIAMADQLPAPRILGLISEDYKPLEAVKGLRLMGQRFVPDAYVFQELIHPKVRNRFLPSGLDVMAALGSPRAQAWLQQDPTTQLEGYAAQFQKMTTWLNGLTQAQWTETAYNGWLYTLRPLLQTPGAGYPQFMQSTAWHDKQLNTALGSWAELKHDTLLYAKQPYGGLGAGGGGPRPPDPVRAQNYVEPVPEVFARIAALAAMTGEGLQQRDLAQTTKDNLGNWFDRLAKVALELKGMAEKELAGQPLSEAEERALHSDYVIYLGIVVRWANDDASQPDPAAIIADVATDPNKGQVLEVGIGGVDEIYVAAPIVQGDGRYALTVARGGVFSYYEFASDQRLTDEAWRTQLAQSAPARPALAGSFSVPQAASLDIQQSIYRFQRDWVNWLYYIGENIPYVDPMHFSVPVSDGVLQQAKATIAAMRDRKQYEGRQWVSTDYLSVERPSASQAVVTVRETWRDFLVQYSGDKPFAWYNDNAPTADPVTARRGPYTVDMRYTLEQAATDCRPSYNRSCYSWRITQFEELTPRPEWGAP
jgi:hypothetical protein